MSTGQSMPVGGSLLSRSNSPSLGFSRNPSHVSLSVNYLPTKFSDALVTRRQAGTKKGGGVEAFRPGEPRVAVVGDDDYDGVSTGVFGGKSSKPISWNRFKWIIFCTNTVLAVWSTTVLVFCLLTWFNAFTEADIIRVGDRTELILSTVAACIGIVTSLIGYAGILLNNRSFLAIYTFMSWVTFASLVVPGYLAYRRRSFNLEGKLNLEWSRALGTEGRLRIQHHLGCCGYFSPYVEATLSQTCYSRSVLPGCKLKYLNFQRATLKTWYTIAFSIVPAQIIVMISGLLCSNHVTYRFGKGMMPDAYRLDLGSMAVIMDNYASELTEQYGAEVASETLARSRSNLLNSTTESH